MIGPIFGNESISWPTTVRCEMNIDEWEMKLDELGLRDRFGYLIEGFKQGFHQGIPSHSIENLKWYCPKNHASALLAREKIEKNFEKKLEQTICLDHTRKTLFMIK